MGKVTGNDLDTWQILLQNTQIIPPMLAQEIRSSDWSEAFPAHDQFFAWYETCLSNHNRLPFIQCLSEEFLSRIFERYSHLDFFKRFHTPEEACNFITQTNIAYDGRSDDPQMLAAWLAWFAPVQDTLCYAISTHIQEIWKTVSFSAFLDVFPGDAVSVLKPCGTAAALINPGDIRTVLHRLQADKDAQGAVYQHLFSTYPHEQFSQSEMDDLIQSLELDTLVRYLLTQIYTNPVWVETLTDRLLALNDRALASLMCDDSTRASKLTHTEQLLNTLLARHPHPNRLKDALSNGRYSNFYHTFLTRNQSTHTSTPVQIDLKLSSLEDFTNRYLRCAASARADFLNKINKDDFKHLAGKASIEGVRRLFTRLYAVRDTHFIQHRLSKYVSSNPTQLACLISIYRNEMDLLTKVFNQQFRFSQAMEREGGLSEFLAGFDGDFPRLLNSLGKPVGWFSSNWGNIYIVHQRSKHDVNANISLCKSILENPSRLYKYYDSKALFDVLNRLPADVLVELLTKHHKIIKPQHVPAASSSSDSPRSYAPVIARLLDSRGSEPKLGRLVYQYYYPDLTAPFWQHKSRCLSLFAFLETPEIMTDFMTPLLRNQEGRQALFALEKQFRSFINEQKSFLEQYQACQKTADGWMMYWNMYEDAWNKGSTPDTGLLLLMLFYIVPAIVNGLMAVAYELTKLGPLRYQFEAAQPSCFPRMLPPDKLLEQARLFFGKCEALRAASQGPVFFAPERIAASSQETRISVTPNGSRSLSQEKSW